MLYLPGCVTSHKLNACRPGMTSVNVQKQMLAFKLELKQSCFSNANSYSKRQLIKIAKHVVIFAKLLTTFNHGNSI